VKGTEVCCEGRGWAWVWKIWERMGFHERGGEPKISLAGVGEAIAQTMLAKLRPQQLSRLLNSPRL
jgi:hypothetical protein